RVLAAGAIQLLFRGQQATLEGFLEAFAPQDLLRIGPLAALGAWLSFMSGRPDQGTLLADIAERASWEGTPPDGTTSFESQRAMLRAAMVRRGPRDALQQAWYAAAREQAGSRWLSSAQMLVGCGYMMTGDEPSAVAAFEASALPNTAALAPSISLAVLASIRIRHGDWHGAADLIARARARLPDAQNEDLLPGVAVSAIEARIAAQRGDTEKARAAIVRAGIIRPVLNYGMPWVSVHALLELARAHLAISDPAGAQVVVREAEQIVHKRPDLGPITAELVDFRRTLEEATFTLAGTSTLTAAELRILQLLPTYLTFGEIADRLAISRNTVKTHAMAIYGKLWASSRSEAVERAVEIGLLEPYPGLARRRD
ncbi:MAG TPA: LuxR C-terminal-related transcriptional regulator, partial [Candidatus Limnocylindrales bacterium]|nr:LuxR C-terminal-related transcriptional regulator [Candidatus Limnocylindrales bacterium]